MPSFTLCSDGLVVTIETEPETFLLLKERDGSPVGRFPLDLRELASALDGKVSLQTVDERGNSVSINGTGKDVTLKLVAKGRPPTTCRLDVSGLRESLEKAEIRV